MTFSPLVVAVVVFLLVISVNNIPSVNAFQSSIGRSHSFRLLSPLQIPKNLISVHRMSRRTASSSSSIDKSIVNNDSSDSGSSNNILLTSKNPSNIDSSKPPTLHVDSLGFSSMNILAATLSALTAAIVASYMKAAVPLLNNHVLTKNHVGTIVAGILASIMYVFRKDFGMDQSSVLYPSKYSFIRQVLRMIVAVIGIGLGFPLAIAGPVVEVGMTIGKVFSSLYDKSSFELMKNCVAAGVCAGFAVCFDAPLSAVVFFMEATRPLIKAADIHHCEENDHPRTPTSILDDNLTLGCLLLSAAIGSTSLKTIFIFEFVVISVLCLTLQRL
jgi:hypothetical protein